MNSQRGFLCQGTDAPLALVVGVMSRPAHTQQRSGVRNTWGSEDPGVLACFVMGVSIKRTPVSPWAREFKKRMDASQREPPKGQMTAHPGMSALTVERQKFGDLLLLNDSAEIDNGGTSGLKHLPFWQHVTLALPNTRWYGKADDDTYLNLPQLLARLPASPSPTALFGTIK